MFSKIEGFRFKICCTISRFRIKISADGPAQRRGGSANGKSARTIKKSFLKIYTFDAAKTVRIVLAIQSHPVFGPGQERPKDGVALGTGEVLKQLKNHVLHGRC